MPNKQCPDCEKMIDEKYVRCMDCNRKAQTVNVNSEILKQLELMNNNLAHIRAHICGDEKLKTALSQPHKKKS